MKIANKKKIELIILERENRINIENDLYFDAIWPDSHNVISDNILNNNSLVLKMYYKNFSMLFTGDIEEKAEKEIVKLYLNTNVLNSTILKVAHHGSKTSSTEEFLELVQPQIALIGVGKDNKFGHPNEEVLKKLCSFGCKVYRTDEYGEVSIVVDNKGRISIVKKY